MASPWPARVICKGGGCLHFRYLSPQQKFRQGYRYAEKILFHHRLYLRCTTAVSIRIHPRKFGTPQAGYILAAKSELEGGIRRHPGTTLYAAACIKCKGKRKVHAGIVTVLELLKFLVG